MKKSDLHKVGKIVCLTLILYFPLFQNAGAQTYCTEPGNDWIAGEQDGYSYALWNQNGQGTACMTLGAGALFSGEWEDIQNYLARRGLGYDETQQHQEIGTFYATYDCSYEPIATSGNSYLAIYGWTTSPLKEFYIVEDWRNWIPSMAAGTEMKGTIEVNGAIYDILEATRVNQPSILGIATFQQYFSIRRDVRNSGTINISAHFNKWESMGMDLGNMYEVSFVVEGYQNSGSFEFTELDVFLGEPDGTEETDEGSSAVCIYPNPNTGQITLRLDESCANAAVRIFDALGNTIYARENVNHGSLQLSDLNSGIYFVNVSGNAFEYTTKFLMY